MSLADVTNDLKVILNRRDLKPDMATVFLQQGIRKVQRLLRIPSMERAQIHQTIYGPIQSFELVDDLLQIIDVFANGKPVQHVSHREIMRMTPPTHNIAHAGPGCVGTPEFYGRTGASLFLYPFLSQGSQVIVTYYGRFTPLVNPSDENELTRYAPDLLVYAALTFAADYFQMDQKAAWETEYEGLLAATQDEADQLNNTGGSQVIAPVHGDC